MGWLPKWITEPRLSHTIWSAVWALGSLVAGLVLLFGSLSPDERTQTWVIFFGAACLSELLAIRAERRVTIEISPYFDALRTGAMALNEVREQLRGGR